MKLKKLFLNVRIIERISIGAYQICQYLFVHLQLLVQDGGHLSSHGLQFLLNRPHRWAANLLPGGRTQVVEVGEQLDGYREWELSFLVFKCYAARCRAASRLPPTVLELRASLMRFSAALTSSSMASVSEFLSEFRWSWTFTQILSIICIRRTSVRKRKLPSSTGLNICFPDAHLLRGGCHNALLQPVGLFLLVFPGFMIPIEIILNLERQA